jgi:hypothetical protein
VFGYQQMSTLYGEPAQIAAYVFALTLVDLENAFTDLPTAFSDDVRTASGVAAAAAVQSSSSVPTLGVYAAAFEQMDRRLAQATEEMRATTSMRDQVVAFDRALAWLESCGNIFDGAAQAAERSCSAFRETFSSDLDWLNEQFTDRASLSR